MIFKAKYLMFYNSYYSWDNKLEKNNIYKLMIVRAPDKDDLKVIVYGDNGKEIHSKICDYHEFFNDWEF